MARMPRMRRLEQDEKLLIKSELEAIREKIGEIYIIIDQQYGVSDKKAVRLQALLRKLTEVDRLFECELTTN